MSQGDRGAGRRDAALMGSRRSRPPFPARRRCRGRRCADCGASRGNGAFSRRRQHLDDGARSIGRADRLAGPGDFRRRSGSDRQGTDRGRAGQGRSPGPLCRCRRFRSSDRRHDADHRTRTGHRLRQLLLERFSCGSQAAFRQDGRRAHCPADSGQSSRRAGRHGLDQAHWPAAGGGESRRCDRPPGCGFALPGGGPAAAGCPAGATRQCAGSPSGRLAATLRFTAENTPGHHPASIACAARPRGAAARPGHGLHLCHGRAEESRGTCRGPGPGRGQSRFPPRSRSRGCALRLRPVPVSRVTRHCAGHCAHPCSHFVRCCAPAHGTGAAAHPRRNDEKNPGPLSRRGRNRRSRRNRVRHCRSVALRSRRSGPARGLEHERSNAASRRLVRGAGGFYCLSVSRLARRSLDYGECRAARRHPHGNAALAATVVGHSFARRRRALLLAIGEHRIPGRACARRRGGSVRGLQGVHRTGAVLAGHGAADHPAVGRHHQAKRLGSSGAHCAGLRPPRLHRISGPVAAIAAPDRRHRHDCAWQSPSRHRPRSSTPPTTRRPASMPN